MATSWLVGGSATGTVQAICRRHLCCCSALCAWVRTITVSWLPCADLLEDADRQDQDAGGAVV